MARITLADMQFEVDTIVYQVDGVAVYVCDGDLVIDDGTDEERTTDTPDNRELYIQRAKTYFEKEEVPMQKWYATINGDDDINNDIIKIGIVKRTHDESEGYDLIASNGDDVSQGLSTFEEAYESIGLLWGQWETLNYLERGLTNG